MAALTAQQLAVLRKHLVRARGQDQEIDFDKPTVNAALQAIEDLIEANKTAIGNAIDTATSPYTFTAADKKRLFGVYAALKSGLELV